ncbi:hypothetical protein FBY35_4080 [Streptomyces sp. SLBN-118]|nr:hypothetical protein FBY35_4080 [Streptomyces sp. SLBN-118]
MLGDATGAPCFRSGGSSATPTRRMIAVADHSSGRRACCSTAGGHLNYVLADRCGSLSSARSTARCPSARRAAPAGCAVPSGPRGCRRCPGSVPCSRGRPGRGESCVPASGMSSEPLWSPTRWASACIFLKRHGHAAQCPRRVQRGDGAHAGTRKVPAPCTTIVPHNPRSAPVGRSTIRKRVCVTSAETGLVLSSAEGPQDRAAAHPRPSGYRARPPPRAGRYQFG